MRELAGTGKVEKLFRSPWFWLALIFVLCEVSSLIQGSGLVGDPKYLWLMICYSFGFVIALPEFFGLRSTESGTIHLSITIMGSLIYLAFAFSVRWFPRRLIYHLSLVMLLIVLCMSAGCTAWIMSMHSGSVSDDIVAGDGLSYSEYKSKRAFPLITLPESVRQIDFFLWAARDTTYEFIRTTVDAKGIDIDEIAASCELSGVSAPVTATNVAYSTKAFDASFIRIQPKWWKDMPLEHEFAASVLRYGLENDGYGRGCWVFYDKTTHTIVVFLWIEQRFGISEFEKEFGLKRP